MTNEYGLDVDYFKKKLELILRDVGNYTPDEMYRELTRLATTAYPDNYDSSASTIEEVNLQLNLKNMELRAENKRIGDYYMKINSMYWNDEIFVVKNGEGFYTDKFVDLFVEF